MTLDLVDLVIFVILANFYGFVNFVILVKFYEIFTDNSKYQKLLELKSETNFNLYL